MAAGIEIGNEVRGVTRATRGAASAGVGVAGAFVTIIAYVLVRTGLESDAETAALLAGSIVTAGSVAVAWIAATYAGKRTPSDPAVPPVPVAVDMPDPDAVPDADEGVAELPGEPLPPAPSPNPSRDAQRG